MSYNPQESLENTINTMGTWLGVRPKFPLWKLTWNSRLGGGGKMIFLFMVKISGSMWVFGSVQQPNLNNWNASNLLAVPRFKSLDPINTWTLLEYSTTFTTAPVVSHKDPCMADLPTCSVKLYGFHVGKYTIHGPYGFSETKTKSTVLPGSLTARPWK